MKLPKLGLPLRIAAGNAHDVAIILLHEVLVLVNECLPHAGGVFFIHTEDDGLLEAVAAFLQELGHFLRHQLRPVVNHQRAVEILRL